MWIQWKWTIGMQTMKLMYQGINSTITQTTPQQLDLEGTCTMIHAGNDFSFLVTDECKLFAFGCNEHGQLVCNFVFVTLLGY